MSSDQASSNLNVVISSLLDSTSDKDSQVREAVCKSLQALSKEYTGTIVQSISLFRQRNPKLNTQQLVILMKVLENIAQEKGNGLEGELVEKLVKFSVDEITRSDTNQEVQAMSRNILIALGTKHCTKVLGGLMPQLQPGTEPCACIVSTLGHLANSDVFQFVPIIKVAMGIMVPMMTNARGEQIRIAFSLAIGKFCEAILEYMSVTDEKKDKAVSRNSFADEISQAYDVIANSWIQAKETKVTESAIAALGPVFSMLPEEKAAASTSRAILCLISAYKRPCILHYLITQCLASILQAAPPHAVQPLLDAVLQNLGSMVLKPPDYAVPHTVKLHNEVLRCYDNISIHFGERLNDLIVKHLRHGNERDKIEALIVSSHLISSGNSVLKARINEITCALRSVLSEPSVKVKKALVRVIASLAYKGYIDDGSDLIEFLVRHCSSLPTHLGIDYSELTDMCVSTIELSTTVENLHRLLWTTLLKLLTDPTYDSAVPVITKTLTQIAPKMDPKQNYGINHEAALCRCFSLLGSPMFNNRGPSILCFLQNYSPHVSCHIGDLWAHKLPQLINYLQVSEWGEAEWDSLLLELINNTVTTISCHDAQWPVTMSNQLSRLLSSNLHRDEASVVLSALAITTAVIEDKQYVSTHLDTVLAKLKVNDLDVKACARAVGILSTAHLDLVLSRLETIAQTELSRRNSRLLGLMKDSKAELEMEKCREALLHCYASIAHRCPLMELLPKLDGLTVWMMTQITVAKEQTGREAAMEAILNCAESLVRHKTEAKHSIKSRSQILDVVTKQMINSRPDPIAIKLSTALIKLPPSLVMEARTHVLKTCFDNVLRQESPANGHDGIVSQQSLKHLGELVEELLLDSITPDRLDEITTIIDPWIKHKHAYQRLGAIITLRTALLAYYTHMNLGYETPSNLSQTGDLVGTLVVRSFDSNPEISKIARHCTGIVLAIVGIYEGNSHNSAVEKIFEDLPEEKGTWTMIEVLCKKLPYAQLHKLTGRLLDGLTDFDPPACCSASDALTAVFTLKGAELFHYVNDILGALLLQLTTVGNNASNGVSAVIALTKHHPKLVLNILLRQPLPLHQIVSDVWKNLGADSLLSTFALDHILSILSTSELYDDNSTGTNRPKVAAAQPLAAVSGLAEMVEMHSMSTLLRSNLPQLLPTLLTLMAAYIGTSPPVLAPSPSKSSLITNRDAFRIIPPYVVKVCLQKVLLCVNCNTGAEALLASSQLQNIESLLTCVPQLTLSVCQCFPTMLPKLLTGMNLYTSSNLESQRIITMSFYSECLAVQCLSSTGGEESIIDALINSLLKGVVDPDQMVRAIALKGLNYTAQLPENQRRKLEESVLKALMQGLDDTEGSVHTRIPLEAMKSLSGLIPKLDREAILRIQNPVAIRVKPFFEKEELALRSVSLQLFGQLSCEDQEAQAGYQEQVRSCFVCLILHLSELEPAVVKSCKFSLRRIAHLLDAPQVSSMLRDHLIDEAVLQYEQFITALSKLIVQEMEDLAVNMISMCLTYTKSNWYNIRGNAALLLGCLYKSLGEEAKQTIGLDPISSRLVQMMADQNREVRCKCVQALSFLFL